MLVTPYELLSGVRLHWYLCVFGYLTRTFWLFVFHNRKKIWFVMISLWPTDQQLLGLF
jgi:hypothetical protein